MKWRIILNKINQEIKGDIVLVVGPNSRMPLKEALNLASEKNLDLVQVSEQDIPVCKIMDYKKYIYDQKKKEKENLKKQKQSIQEVKEIRLSCNIDNNDLSTKAHQASKFLSKNKKVKITLRLKGRESELLARKTIQSFLDAVTEDYINPTINQEGRILYCVISK